jgi:hypothetical protein
MDTRAVLGMAEMLGRKDAAAELKLRFNAVNTAMLHGPQSGWACFYLFEDVFVLVQHILDTLAKRQRQRQRFLINCSVCDVTSLKAHALERILGRVPKRIINPTATHYSASTHTLLPAVSRPCLGTNRGTGR